MNAGGLVGDDVMIPLVAERVAKPDIMSGGVLLDGFPRTADQANGLEAMLADLGQELTIAINLDVPVEEVTERMMARGREDDTEEAIARRLSLYEEQTAPLLDWFADRGFWPRSTVWARRTRCSPVSRRPSTAEWPRCTPSS